MPNANRTILQLIIIKAKINNILIIISKIIVLYSCYHLSTFINDDSFSIIGKDFRNSTIKVFCAIKACFNNHLPTFMKISPLPILTYGSHSFTKDMDIIILRRNNFLSFCINKSPSAIQANAY